MRQKNFTVRPWGKFGLVLGLLGLLAGSYYVGVTNQSSSSDTQKIKVCQNYGKLPLYFIENKGQVDSRVKFYEKAGGHAIYFTPENIYFALRKKENAVKVRHMEMTSPGTSPDTQEKAAPPAVVQLTPLGMQTGVKIEAVEPQEARFNYFIGNDPAKWRTNIPSYRAVVYREAYPGIDLKFYGTGRQLEYDIMVKPGADPNRVKFQYAGIKNLEVTGTGDLAIKLPDGGQLIQKKPIVYQEIAGQRLAREGKFRIQQNTAQLVYGIEVAAYDQKYSMVIDPVLVYSTYLGGSNYDFGNGIAVDADGNAYVTGRTDSDIPLPPFPPPVPLGTTEGPFQPSRAGVFDAFVVKLNPEGTSLIYGTYLGGSGYDVALNIAVDNNGNAHLTGYTRSTSDFPLAMPLQPTYGGGYSDAFVTKLNASGSGLLFSTYLGSSGLDRGQGIAVDNSGNSYITGAAGSDDFPTTEGSYQTDRIPGYYSFLTKISFDGSILVYSTYISYLTNGIAVDEEGCAYVTGEVVSGGFLPVVNPYQPNYGGGDYDAFVTKMNTAGTGLVYSTYLGGDGDDHGYGIAVDSSGNAYVTGFTDSTDFPTLNAFQSQFAGGLYDAFVTKIKADGSALVYSTYLGGSDIPNLGNDADYGYGIAVDAFGAAYIIGHTWAEDFPLKNPLFSELTPYADAFITKINPTGTDLEFSSYIKGTEYGRGIAVDDSGNAYVTGTTYDSSNFPLVNPLQPDLGGLADAFVAKIFTTSPKSIELMIKEIEALVDDGVLNKGQGNSLNAKLTDALDQLDKENTHAAIQKLQEFISVVEGYIRTGKLSDEEGQSLIGAAENVISLFG